MNRRSFVRTLVAPAFMLPLTRTGERDSSAGSLYLISEYPERYVPLLLEELWRLGLGKTNEPSIRTAIMRESRLPSFTAALNGRVIDLRRLKLASLWKQMQNEDPSSRLTVVEFGRPRNSGRQGREAIIKVDGHIIDKLPLSQAAGRVYAVRGGYISVRIDNRAAHIEESTCPQKICASSPPISAAGERIICAPHRFILEIPGRGAWDTTTG